MAFGGNPVRPRAKLHLAVIKRGSLLCLIKFFKKEHENQQTFPSSSKNIAVQKVTAQCTVLCALELFALTLA